MGKVVEIFLLSCVLALVVYFLKPIERNTPGPGIMISVQEVKAQEQEVDFLFVDARSRGGFMEGHIPEAIHLTEDDWDTGLMGFMELWSPEITVIVYCDSAACQSSEQVANRLQDELGIDNVRVLKGGWEAWQEAGQPIESSQS